MNIQLVISSHILILSFPYLLLKDSKCLNFHLVQNVVADMEEVSAVEMCKNLVDLTTAQTKSAEVP